VGVFGDVKFHFRPEMFSLIFAWFFDVSGSSEKEEWGVENAELLDNVNLMNLKTMSVSICLRVFLIVLMWLVSTPCGSWLIPTRGFWWIYGVLGDYFKWWIAPSRRCSMPPVLLNVLVGVCVNQDLTGVFLVSYMFSV
jgi:hypothetical protein